MKIGFTGRDIDVSPLSNRITENLQVGSLIDKLQRYTDWPACHIVWIIEGQIFRHVLRIAHRDPTKVIDLYTNRTNHTSPLLIRAIKEKPPEWFPNQGMCICDFPGHGCCCTGRTDEHQHLWHSGCCAAGNCGHTCCEKNDLVTHCDQCDPSWQGWLCIHCGRIQNKTEWNRQRQRQPAVADQW